MYTAEMEVKTPDIAARFRNLAIDDMRERGLFAALCKLKAVSPSCLIGGVVVSSDNRRLIVHDRGELVFSMTDFNLKRYIYGDWVTSVLDKAEGL